MACKRVWIHFERCVGISLSFCPLLCACVCGVHMRVCVHAYYCVYIIMWVHVGIGMCVGVEGNMLFKHFPSQIQLIVRTSD